MRLSPPVVLVGLLLAAPAGAADEPLYSAAVSQSEAEVRSGPGVGPGSLVTNRLPRGQTVLVLRDRGDGWLEIRPPQGSVSWINMRFVERIASEHMNWAVTAPPEARVPVFVGTGPRKEGPLTVAPRESAVPRGTQVRSLGPPQTDEDGQWLPIEPPPGERRYVRADSVTRSAVPAPTVAASSPAGNLNPTGSNVTATPGGAVAPAPQQAAPLAVEALWNRATQAERLGNITEAVDWYNRVITESAATRPEYAAAARDRVLYLTQTHRLPDHPASTASAAGGPSVSAADGQGRLRPLPAEAGRPTVRLAAPSGTSDPPSAAQPSPPGTPVKPAWQPAPDGYPSSGPGKLRRAGRVIEGRKTYVLESSQNYPLLYVTPGPNVDLEPYLNQYVELFGPAVYSGDLRANYMTVMRVQPAP